MRVLVADDEPGVREMLSEFLTLRGFEVLEAANGLETLLQVKHQRPGAVLLDLGMPRLGGLEALKRIRVFDPAIVVVVITAEADPELLRQAVGLGARAVLPKPVVLAEVLTVLQGDVPGSDTSSAASPKGSSETAVEGAAAPASAEPRAADPPPCVLIVDDDAEVREMLTEFLSLRRYHVTGAADGAAAVRAIVAAPPDVVLLDIEMPGLKGTEALPTIRAVAPRSAVIMVSGTADADLAKRTLAHGAFDYVIKPVDLNYLTQSIETALTMKALEPET